MIFQLYRGRMGFSQRLVFLLSCSWFLLQSFSAVFAAELKMIDAETFQEQKSGKMWQLERSRKFRATEEVENYLHELNKGRYADWRLPTKQELYELFVFFDLKKNGDVKVPKEGNYWYAGEYGQIEVGAWEEGDG